MASNTRTTTVIGWVDFYDPAKGFGFAEVRTSSDPVLGSDTKVFFRKEGCREVKGTLERPMITRAPSGLDLLVPIRRAGGGGSRNPSRVVMTVERTSRGLRALNWGIIPLPQSIEDLVRTDGLAPCKGRLVKVLERRQGHRDPEVLLEGTLVNFELSLTHLRIVVQAFGTDGTVLPPAERTFEFDDAWITAMRYDRFTLHPQGDGDVLISFSR